MKVLSSVEYGELKECTLSRRVIVRRARNLADALLEVRELVASGSEEMMIIDEALSKVEIKPYKSE